MIDPLVSLSFSVYSNRGVYALLLGSGVSRPAGIPTGWEVILDLTRKVAQLEGVDCGADSAEWFAKTKGKQPDYSKLLAALAKTPSERQRLLRSYFEPTEEERAQGIKAPTAAHKAIAGLVAAGFIRVIVTTNFDRLLEKALEAAGVVTTIISSADHLSGALPLSHSGVTLIKLHGDYLDTRIRNTEEELSKYEDVVERLLDRVFDEYGLIVSGWSGEWDSALRAAIERCPNRRFTTYWTGRGKLVEKAAKLAARRRAELVTIKSADDFFQRLLENVQSLEACTRPHPLSAKMATETVKRYLIDNNNRIRPHDLVRDETDNLLSLLASNAPPPPLQAKTAVEKYNAWVHRGHNYFQ